jgi:osmoprotectant transport system permease protein
MESVLAWFSDPANWTGPTGIPTRLVEHLQISFLAVAAATAIGLPIGLYIGHTGRFANLAINLANIGRAVPSYALMVAILPLSLTLAPTIGYDPSLGLTFLPIFLAMTLLAIPPILVGAYAGLREVDRDLIEAGRGMGMREMQILRRIEVPIASPIILGGFRTATLQVIATATIGAILSYGGLGRFIVDGIARGTSGSDMLFAGAVLVTALALVVDGILAVVQRILTPRALRGGEGMRPPEQMDETVVDPGMLGVQVRP